MGVESWRDSSRSPGLKPSSQRRVCALDTYFGLIDQLVDCLWCHINQQKMIDLFAKWLITCGTHLFSKYLLKPSIEDSLKLNIEFWRHGRKGSLRLCRGRRKRLPWNEPRRILWVFFRRGASVTIQFKKRWSKAAGPQIASFRSAVGETPWEPNCCFCEATVRPASLSVTSLSPTAADDVRSPRVELLRQNPPPSP